jgi:hypothetical protein
LATAKTSWEAPNPEMAISYLKTRKKVPTRQNTAIRIVCGTSHFIRELTTSTFQTRRRSQSVFIDPISIYETKFSPLIILHVTCLDSCMFPATHFRCIVLPALMCNFYRRSERVHIHRRIGHRICGSIHCALTCIIPK